MPDQNELRKRRVCFTGHRPEKLQMSEAEVCSARVIAVFNGEKGGTKNTIDYANRHGVPVVFIS